MLQSMGSRRVRHSRVSELNRIELESFLDFPGGASGKDSTYQCMRCKRCRFNHLVEKIPWSRKWQPIPIFLPGKSHGQRRLVGCSPWGHKSQT